MMGNIGVLWSLLVAAVLGSFAVLAFLAIGRLMSATSVEPLAQTPETLSLISLPHYPLAASSHRKVLPEQIISRH
jgi:hypothetical protein